MNNRRSTSSDSCQEKKRRKLPDRLLQRRGLSKDGHNVPAMQEDTV